MAGLHFGADLNNDKLLRAIDETLRRIQGLSDATVAGGEEMDSAFNKTATEIEEAFQKLDKSAGLHKTAISALEKEYGDLKKSASEAFNKGDDKAFSRLSEKQKAIQSEIKVRKRLLKEIGATANALIKEEQALDARKAKLKKHTKAVQSFETQLRLAREKVMALEAAGKRNTDEYVRAQKELGRLRDIMNDANRQAKVLAHDQADFQGVLSGLTGLAGGYSAVAGSVAFFAGENENLQLVMTKVQSLMSITIGMQQVQQALDKDSAFRLVTLAKAKKAVASATNRLSASFTGLGLSAGAARVTVQALYAALTVGLSLAITGVVYLIDKHNKKQEEAKERAKATTRAYEKQSARLKKLAKSYAQKVAMIETYRGALRDENLSHSDKLRVLKKLQKIVPDYTAKLNKEGEVIWENKKAIDAYLVSLERSLKFKAAMEDLTELYSKVYEVEKKPKESATKKGTINGTEVEIVDYAKLANDAGVNLQTATSKTLETLQAFDKVAKELNDGAAKNKLDSLRAEIEQVQNYIADNGLLDLSFEGSDTTKKDPFKQMLQNRRSEYEKFKGYLGSGDEVLIEIGKKGLEKLKTEGDTYLEFLKNKQTELLKTPESKRSSTQKKDLESVNTAIATESKNTVTKEFSDGLKKQLDTADSVLAKLKIIEQFRKGLEGDTSGLRAEKEDILNSQAGKVEGEAQKRTKGLLKDYADYLDKKLDYDKKYVDDIALLNAQLEKATTKKEKGKINRAKDNRTKDYESHSGDADYDVLLNDYADFERRKDTIIKDFDEKRAVAKRNNDEKLLQELNRKQKEKLSELAFEELQASPDWELLFGDLDEVSTRKLQGLIDKIENLDAYLGVKLNPADLAKMKEQLKATKGEVQQRNPFKALGTAFSKWKKATNEEAKKGASKEMFSSAADAAGLLSQGMDSVVGGMQQMGITMDEETQVIMKDIGGIVAGAGQIAEGIATKNPIAVVQGSIQLLSSAFDLFNSKDRKANRQIKKHAEAIKKLEFAYQDLSRAVDKALGKDVYSNQKALIRNLQEQRGHLQGMISAERSKKKTDHNKIREYQQQYKQLGYTIEDTLESIAKDIVQTDAKSYADELGTALVAAFKKGGDAATGFKELASKEFEEVSNKIVQNAVFNQLKKNLLEKPLGEALKGLEKSLGYWQGDNFIFDGLTDAEVQSFKNSAEGATSNFNKALKTYEKVFRAITDKDISKDLTGSIKGVTEGTASMVGGQVNAMRITQAEGVEQMRLQLFALQNIEKNTRHNSNLTKLEMLSGLANLEGLGAKLDAIQDALKTSDTLRAKGLS